MQEVDYCMSNKSITLKYMHVTKIVNIFISNRLTNFNFLKLRQKASLSKILSSIMIKHIEIEWHWTMINVVNPWKECIFLSTFTLWYPYSVPPVFLFFFTLKCQQYIFKMDGEDTYRYMLQLYYKVCIPNFHICTRTTGWYISIFSKGKLRRSIGFWKVLYIFSDLKDKEITSSNRCIIDRK